MEKTQGISAKNRLIAEFMDWYEGGKETVGPDQGMTIFLHPFEGYAATLLDFHYDTSWTELMPVWKKCHEIGYWMMTNNHDKLWLEKSKEIESAIVNEVDCQKAATLISHLIKWYNENKQS